MTSRELQQKALQTLVALNAAIKNIRLYPPASDLVQKSVERTLPPMETIFESREELNIAESEKSLLIFGTPLTEKEQQAPQVIAFIATLLDFGIKGLTFKRGVAIEEIGTLLQVLSGKSEDVIDAGGLRDVLSASALPHIVVDEKVYMAVDNDRQLVSGMDLAGEEVVKFIASGKSASDPEMAQLKALAKDPGWVANVFASGIKHQMSQGGDTAGTQVAGTLQHLVAGFEDLTDNKSKTTIAKQIAASIVNQDDAALAQVVAREYAGNLGQKLSDQIVDQMPDDQFERIVLNLKATSALGDQAASAAYRKLVVSDKGRKLGDSLKKRAAKQQTLKKQKAAQYKAGLKGLLQGDLATLADQDFVENLPKTAAQLIDKGKLEPTETLAEKLMAGMATADPKSRSQIYKAYQSIREKLPEDRKTELASKTMGELLEWVRLEDTLTPEYELAGSEIVQQALRLVKKHNFGQLNIILGIFNFKAVAKQAGDEAIRQHAEKTLKTIGSDETWKVLHHQFALLEEHQREPAIQSQVLLGIAAQDRLLDLLETSEEMPDRVHLVRIIAGIGKPAVAKIRSRIQKGGVWYYLRNLVSLLGKIGGPEEVEILEPLLLHKDFRLRRETLNSIYSIGGPARGPALLKYLSAASDKEKAGIAAMLGALKYTASADTLLAILKTKPALDAGAREQLFEKTCIALGKIGATSAAPILEKVSQGKGALKKAYTRKVRDAAQKALGLIAKAPVPKPALLPKAAQPQPLDPDLPKPVAKAAEPEVAADGREARIDELVAAGETDAAVQLLFELLVEHAKKKNFKKAEELRDRLYDVDAMALTEIVKAGEIIEQEKAESIDRDHLDVWPELYDKLTSEEANALFHAMEEVAYDIDQTVFAQGHKNDHLYFVTAGRLKLVYRDGKREALLKKLERGDLAGQATFFSISMCTTSLIALSDVKMNVLHRDVLELWENDFPALKSKLEDYCLQLEKSRDIIKKKGVERRRQERFNVKGKILAQLLNQKRQPMGKPFKGDFADISEGGLSFYIITSKRETARTLLGRRLGLQFLIPTGAAPLKTFQHGTVICVNYHLKNDYSIHVSFDDELPNEITTAIGRLKRIKF